MKMNMIANNKNKPGLQMPLVEIADFSVTSLLAVMYSGNELNVNLSKA